MSRGLRDDRRSITAAVSIDSAARHDPRRAFRKATTYVRQAHARDHAPSRLLCAGLATPYPASRALPAREGRRAVRAADRAAARAAPRAVSDARRDRGVLGDDAADADRARGSSGASSSDSASASIRCTPRARRGRDVDRRQIHEAIQHRPKRRRSRWWCAASRRSASDFATAVRRDARRAARDPDRAAAGAILLAGSAGWTTAGDALVRSRRAQALRPPLRRTRDPRATAR